jgi:hypothetical protein
MHVGRRTSFPHDRSGAADMIRVAVSENEMLELIRGAAKSAHRLKDDRLFARVTGVDQRQPVVALDQEGICHSHWDDLHTFDHILYSHSRTLARRRTQTDGPVERSRFENTKL